MTTSSVFAERDYFEAVSDTGSTTARKGFIEATGRDLSVQVVGTDILVKVDGTPPEWFESVVRQLQSLEELRQGWDGEGAPPVNIYSVASSIAVLAHLMTPTTPIPAVVAGTNGDVILEWHARGADLELKVGPTGPTHVFMDSPWTSWSEPVRADIRPFATALRQIS